LAKGEKASSIATRLGVSKQSASDIKASRTRQEGIKVVVDEKLDKALHLWFFQERCKGTLILMRHEKKHTHVFSQVCDYPDVRLSELSSFRQKSPDN
jgi:hypothetical protein